MSNIAIGRPSIRLGSDMIVGNRPGLSLAGGGGGPWYRAGGAPAPWAAYQPIGAASLGASYVNLANPGTRDAAAGVAPTFDAATGWTFNGSTQYLVTTFRPDADQTQTVIVQYTGAVTNDGYALGSQQVAGRAFGLRPIADAGSSVRYYNGNTQAVTPALAAGNLAVSGSQGYRNGVAEGAAIGAWTGATLQDVFIGCNNQAGTPASFSSIVIRAVALYDVTLTATQVAAVATAMAGL